MKKLMQFLIIMSLLTAIFLLVMTGCGNESEKTGETTTSALPITTPVSTTPVGTVPVTTAPVTTAPVTTAPVTTVPVTTVPVTTVPVTTEAKVDYNEVVSRQIDISYTFGSYMKVQYNVDGKPLYRAALDYNTMQARDSAQKIYYEYNEEGALSGIILFDRGTELTCELEYYNDNLNLSAVAIDDYGRETEIVFEFDENGKVLSESLYSTNGLVWMLEYGEGGSVAKETAYRATIEMVGIYTRNGLETKFSMSMLGSVTMDATVTYNEALLPIKNEQTAYGQTSTVLYTWNEKNLCIATTALDASGAKFEYAFEYNDKDALEKETCLKYDVSGNLTEKTVTEYRFNEEGKATSKVVSQYDAEGNLTNTTETTL